MSEMSAPPITAQYAALVAAGEIEEDPAQEEVVAKLARLNERLAMHRLARKSSSLGWLFGQKVDRGQELKGLYIWGDVGRGKTMLMDMFFAACPVLRKRRAHFHQFMLDVQDRLNVYRAKLKAGETLPGDPIHMTADELAEEAWVLCFDEFHVTDIADAMILGRLFTRLFERGVVVVATSNVEPADLYRDGLNRSLFVPFIALLMERMEVVRLAARTDFRMEKLIGVKVWHVPADAAAERALDEAWRRLTGGRQRPAARPPGQGPQAARAARHNGRRALHVSRSLRAAARRGRLSAHRPRIPHRHHRPCAGDGLCDAQRGQALHRADRHAL